MLLYHFGTKEALIADLLAFLARAYAGALDAAMAGERARSRAEVVARILAEGDAPQMQPFMALWWEIVAGCARGVPGYQPAAQAMMHELLGWLEGQMPAGDPDPAGGARYLLTMIEGAVMLGAVGHGDTARDGLLAGGLAAS
jgi:AcrR family transcriptional regulator